MDDDEIITDRTDVKRILLGRDISIHAVRTKRGYWSAQWNGMPQSRCRGFTAIEAIDKLITTSELSLEDCIRTHLESNVGFSSLRNQSLPATSHEVQARDIPSHAKAATDSATRLATVTTIIVSILWLTIGIDTNAIKTPLGIAVLGIGFVLSWIAIYVCLLKGVKLFAIILSSSFVLLMVFFVNTRIVDDLGVSHISDNRTEVSRLKDMLAAAQAAERDSQRSIEQVRQVNSRLVEQSNYDRWILEQRLDALNTELQTLKKRLDTVFPLVVPPSTTRP